MKVAILGPVQVTDNGRPLSVGGWRQRSLVSFLALHAGEVVLADRLLLDVESEEYGWEGHRNVLYGRIAQLRKALGAASIRTTGGGYMLDVDAHDVDALEFLRLHREGTAALASGRASVAAALLREGLALWRGDVMEDVVEKSTRLLTEARHLEEMKWDAVEKRFDAELHLGYGAELTADIRLAINDNPLREPFHVQLMTALYRSGRQAEALKTYQDLRTRLADIGLVPSPISRDVEMAILKHDPRLRVERTPREALAFREFGARMTVFVSHTEELRAFPSDRSFVDAATSAIRRAGMTPSDVGGELGGTSVEIGVDPISSRSDVYVAIVGFKYGPLVGQGREASYPEVEYERATLGGLPRLVFRISEHAVLPVLASRDVEFGVRQDNFRSKLQSDGLVVADVMTPDELERRLYEALCELARVSTTPSESGRKLRVLLCHASDDKPRVRDLYQRLRMDRFSPWLDEESILPGQDWELEITKAVREVDVVLVCLSRVAVTKTGYLQKEIRKVLDVAEEQPDGSVFAIPVRLEDCPVPERLRKWQWVNVYDDRGYERLLAALHAQSAVIAGRVAQT